MKKLLTLFAFVVITISSYAGGTFYDYSFENDGIYYVITSSSDHTVGVTYYSVSYISYHDDKGNGIYSVDYTSNYSGEVVIPSTVVNNGIVYSVTSITGHAFDGCSDLISVTIPNTVTSIGENAFQGCSGLLNVYCHAETVPTTASNAFDGSNISNATLQVPASAFDAYRSATTWNNFENIITEFFDAYIDGIYYKLNSTTKEATVTYKDKNYNSYSGSVAIPEKIAWGGIEYFVTSIGENAFYNCSGLTSVEIPNNVTSIEKSAFSYCSKLTSVILGNSVMSIGFNAFCYCTALKNVYCCNENVPQVNTYSFTGCDLSKATLYVPDRYKYESADYWKNFGTILSGKCGSCGENASYVLYDDGTLVISGSGDMFDYIWYFVAGDFYESFAPWCLEKVTQVQIKDGITSIGSGAFLDCNLTTVTIPNSVTRIGDGAFLGCFNVTFDLEEGNTNYCSIDNVLFNKDMTTLICCVGNNGTYTVPNSVTNIGSFAFSNCSSLTSVTIPSSVTSIGVGAFYECNRLTSVEIPNSVTTINERTFAHSGLTSITIPNSVTSIGVEAFRGCGLTSIVIPNSVTSIYDYAFQSCALKSLTIPASVKDIGYGVFEGCSSLTSITCEGTTPLANVYDIFYDVPRTALVEVPYGLVSTYKSADGWKEFTNIYTLGDANLSGTEPDVTDFNYTVNYILGEEPTGFFFTGADYNKNGVVNVIDAIAIGRLITNGTTEARSRKFRAPAVDGEYGQDILCVGETIVAAGTEFTLPVSITPDRYSSMQMDIQIPEGFSVVDVTNGIGAEGHSLFHGKHDDGVLRIMLGSLENTKMGEAPIIDIKLVAAHDLADGQYDFYISNILAVTPELETTSGKTLNVIVSVGDATSIKGANQSGLELARTDGGINITTDAPQTVAIRTIDGKLIANEHVNAGETKTISLPAGIYIINNSKIIIK